MGYYTSVFALLEIKPECVEIVKEDIEKAKKFCESSNGTVHWQEGDNKPTYFDYHKADSVIEEHEGKHYIRPRDEDDKWYGMDEYLSWLQGMILEGEFEWRGEEFDDYGAYKWENGKMFAQSKEWKPVPERCDECGLVHTDCGQMCEH